MIGEGMSKMVYIIFNVVINLKWSLDVDGHGKKIEGKEIRECKNWEKIKRIKIDFSFTTKEISLPLYTSPCKRFNL